MIVLRQKQFGWFGFGKRKDEPKPTIQYKCPSISDLPSNLQASLRGVEKVWKKPDVQKLLKELQRLVGHLDIFPYTPYVNPENAFNNFILMSLKADEFPEDTLMYPLMWDCGKCDGNLICYDITTKKFWAIDGNDWNFEEYDYIKKLSDWMKYDLDFIEKYTDEEDLEYYGVSRPEFKDLLKKIKKAFWL